MKKLIILTTLIVVLSAGCVKGNKTPNENLTTETKNSTSHTTTTETTKQEALTAKDFFCFEEDVFMDFKGTGNEFAEYKTYVDYVKNDIVQIRNMGPGTVSVFVYQYKDGELIRTYSRGETYYLYDYTAFREKEEIIIKEPIEEGTSWKVGESSTRSITSINKEVETPLGKYDALEITTEDANSIIKDYYVKNVGKVKSEFVSKDEQSYTITSELQRLEKDSSNKQDIKFYFPDFNNDRIINVVRLIEFRTNQDIANTLQEGLKLAPPGDDIKGTITKNVEILGINIDDKKGIVSVDFSSNLVSDMNAGGSYESMILSSLANTFGCYFQKDKVIITLEGKPYSSGHILMREGEYITVGNDNAK